MHITEKIKGAIVEVANDLARIEKDYFIIGASALALSGIDIKSTEDIDILTSKQDAKVLQKLWKDKIIGNYNPQRSDLFRSNFSRYKFQRMDIEVMGGLEINIDRKWVLLSINDYNVHNISCTQIKIPTLQEQRRILTLFGREKDYQRIKLIDNYLSRY